MALSGRSSIALALLLATSSCPSTFTHALAPASAFEGLWQYPGRGVWIHVWPDGFAFQCRIAPDGTVFASAGALSGQTVA